MPSRRLEAEQIAQALGQQGTVGWLDLEAATPEELCALEGLFGLHPLAIEDAQNPETRPKIEEYDNFLFVVTRGINHNPGATALDLIPLYVFLNRHLIVTVHPRPMRSVATAIERLRKHPELLQSGPDRLLHHLLDHVVDYYFPIMDGLEDRVEELEDEVFQKPGEGLLERIFAARKELAALRRSLGPLREVVANLMGGVPYVDADLRPFFRDVYDHVLRLLDELETNRDILGGLLESYLSQASNRMNAGHQAPHRARDDRLAVHRHLGLLRDELRGDALAQAAVGDSSGDRPHVRVVGRRVRVLQEPEIGCEPPVGSAGGRWGARVGGGTFRLRAPSLGSSPTCAGASRGSDRRTGFARR